jgi:hypothetical protein
MARMTGRRVPLSLPRRWIDDLMATSRGVPLVTFERRMALAAVATARRDVDPSPSWVMLFAKAYAIVASRRPELRRAYVPFPVPHLYEADESVASVAVEREYGGEPAVFFGLLRSPDKRPLAELMRRLSEWKRRPLKEVREFCRLLKHTRLPRPLRRLMWWYGMNTSGRRRARHFGTFGISVTAGLGAAAVNLISPLATTLSYGVLDNDGSLDVRLHFDHRVLDGAPAARALAELENVLRTTIVAELRQMATVPPFVSREHFQHDVLEADLHRPAAVQLERD